MQRSCQINLCFLHIHALLYEKDYGNKNILEYARSFVVFLYVIENFLYRSDPKKIILVWCKMIFVGLSCTVYSHIADNKVLFVLFP